MSGVRKARSYYIMLGISLRYEDRRFCGPFFSCADSQAALSAAFDAPDRQIFMDAIDRKLVRKGIRVFFVVGRTEAERTYRMHLAGGKCNVLGRVVPATTEQLLVMEESLAERVRGVLQ